MSFVYKLKSQYMTSLPMWQRKQCNILRKHLWLNFSLSGFMLSRWSLVLTKLFPIFMMHIYTRRATILQARYSVTSVCSHLTDITVEDIWIKLGRLSLLGEPYTFIHFAGQRSRSQCQKNQILTLCSVSIITKATLTKFLQCVDISFVHPMDVY